jgi:hypothetical protein
MKQSPFKFQGNTSKQAKSPKNKAGQEHEDAGKQPIALKNLKSVQTKAKTNTNIRTGRPVNTQKPKGK